MKHVLVVLLGIIRVLLILWATAALYLDARWTSLRLPLAVLFGVAMLAVWIVFFKRPALTRAAHLGGFVVVLGWWLTLRPANDRDWQPDVAVLAYADIAGDQVTVHNIRNCDYRTATDFDVRHYDMTFDLGQLRSADLFMVYWGSPHMAHTMISFGFEGGDHLCFSIEARKEKGERYSPVRGLFRQYELVYVVADERDAVRVRTNYRPGEDVYLLPLSGSQAQLRALLDDYLGRVNRLRHHAEWYGTVTDNCTVSIRNQRAAANRMPWDWRLLLNGHADELLYERGMITINLPLAELKQGGHINARAKVADQSTDFSQLIRQGISGLEL